MNGFVSKYPGTRVVVAVSGGADSMALMHMLAEYSKIYKISITVLTVDHGLRVESADEARMVKRYARDFGLEHFTLAWSGDKPDTGVEEAARTARYNLMIEFCKKNNISNLFLAHHADDQIETFLINLGRGSGVFGLAGMRVVSKRDSVNLVRPLLNYKRIDLEQYCKQNNLEYVMDPMNDDMDLLRVRVRKNRHVMDEMLGITDDRILLAINHLGRVRDSVEHTIDRVISELEIADNRVVFKSNILLDLPVEVQLKLVSHLIQKIGGGEYPAKFESIKRILNMILNDPDNAMTLNRCYIRILNGRVLITREGESKSFNC